MIPLVRVAAERIDAERHVLAAPDRIRHHHRRLHARRDRSPRCRSDRRRARDASPFVQPAMPHGPGVSGVECVSWSKRTPLIGVVTFDGLAGRDVVRVPVPCPKYMTYLPSGESCAGPSMLLGHQLPRAGHGIDEVHVVAAGIPHRSRSSSVTPDVARPTFASSVSVTLVIVSSASWTSFLRRDVVERLVGAVAILVDAKLLRRLERGVLPVPEVELGLADERVGGDRVFRRRRELERDRVAGAGERERAAVVGQAVVGRPLCRRDHGRRRRRSSRHRRRSAERAFSRPNSSRSEVNANFCCVRSKVKPR